MFNRELSLAFRRDNDTGLVRNLPTPEPNIITKRLKSLKLHWEDSIPKKAVEAITNLLNHADIGCLRYVISLKSYT